MAADKFVHLHVHTEFSMLDGAAKLAKLFNRAAELEMPALAMTDHGNLFGGYAFYTAARKAGVKPILGLEAYLTPGTHRSERKRVQFGDGSGDDVAAKGAYTHMTMWAANDEGMRNLFRLSSRSSLEGFFYKPRADRELLAQYAPGMLATTGCPSGEVQTYLRQGMYQKALESAGAFRDIFGPENFFVELMDHGLTIESRVRHDLLKIADDLNLPLVATNDLHYVDKEDADAHDSLLCVSAQSYKDSPNRFKFDGDGYYLKSSAEMRELFREIPQACDTTLDIAERCNISFVEEAGRYMPQFPVPAGETEESWFVKEVWRGLEVRYRGSITAEVRERAEYEIAIIEGKGYSGYFLVVADFINWAKENGIRVGPGRGSGAGSMCAYAMRITDLDPIEHGLIFERFLNPERASMPDFDVDFDDRRRAEVIHYVTEKYGDDRVCQIVTYGTIKAKQAIKDAGRILGKPYGLGDKITKAYPPPVMGKDLSLEKVFNQQDPRYAEGQDFRSMVDNDPEVREVVDTAKGLEGMRRSWGVHAAGVIMSSEPLLDIVPIMKREADGAIITQFDYPACEQLGLVKMDFLGLRNLTILADAVANVSLNRNLDLDLDALSKDTTDPATYALLGRGDTLGVFQFDSSGYQQLCRLMQPDSFSDITALGALFRPGPMGTNTHINYCKRKNGEQEIEHVHPELASELSELLGETYGLLVYQEQVMEIAQRLADYTLGSADLLRRAMGKKKKEVLDKEFVPFRDGMFAHGYSLAAVEALWDTLVPFSNYGFNKSHAAAYGMISYWTAYLKANFPAEYMAALLTSVKDDKDKMALYLSECRRMGIKVLPPDVNESAANFTPVGTDIRFGLTAVRNVGLAVVEGIVAARQEYGPASSFAEFLDHVPLVVCNKRAVESLIKAGAFDSMGHHRHALVEAHEDAIDQIIDLKRNELHGQSDLFGDLTGADLPHTVALPDVAEWDKRTRLAFEREMLGLYVSDHPLNGLEHVLERERDASVAEILAEDGRRGTVDICGLITQITRKQNKNGDYWAIITVEDLEASIEVLLFSRVYESVKTYLAPDTIVRVRGSVTEKDESIEIYGKELTLPNVSDTRTGPLVLTVRSVLCTAPIVCELRQIIQAHPGATDVHVRLVGGDSTTVWKLGKSLRVNRVGPLIADLRALLGPSCLS